MTASTAERLAALPRDQRNAIIDQLTPELLKMMQGTAPHYRAKAAAYRQQAAGALP